MHLLADWQEQQRGRWCAACALMPACLCPSVGWLTRAGAAAGALVCSLRTDACTFLPICWLADKRRSSYRGGGAQPVHWCLRTGNASGGWLAGCWSDCCQHSAAEGTLSCPAACLNACRIEGHQPFVGGAVVDGKIGCAWVAGSW
jgi:hypothetical protein